MNSSVQEEVSYGSGFCSYFLWIGLANQKNQWQVLIDENLSNHIYSGMFTQGTFTVYSGHVYSGRVVIGVYE